jgi:CBS domain containing-hemolysin-like protein
VPKSLALAHAERYALTLSWLVVVMGRVLGPVVWLLTRVTGAVNRLLGVRDVPQDAISSEELKLLVERGGEQGILEAEEEQMISAVMELGESRIHEVMVPRIDIVAVPVTASYDEVVDAIVREGHSRMPVYETSIDNIVGLLYAKDLLPYLKGGAELPPIRTKLRPPLYVPESMSVDDLLHEMQRKRVHIAIVLDSTAPRGPRLARVPARGDRRRDPGRATEEPMVERLSDDEARVDGRADVDELVELFGVVLDDEDAEEYDTVGGLVYHHVGGVPKVGDRVDLDGATLTVETTDGRRVGKVLAVRVHREPEPGDDLED